MTELAESSVHPRRHDGGDGEHQRRHSAADGADQSRVAEDQGEGRDERSDEGGGRADNARGDRSPASVDVRIRGRDGVHDVVEEWGRGSGVRGLEYEQFSIADSVLVQRQCRCQRCPADFRQSPVDGLELFGGVVELVEIAVVDNCVHNARNDHGEWNTKRHRKIHLRMG